MGTVALAQAALNDRANQETLATLLLEKTRIKADFKNLSISLFTGEFSGEDIALNFQKTDLSFELKKFSIRFNPLSFLIAKIDITAVFAEEIHLDTSHVTPSEPDKTKSAQIPQFLRRLSLKRAAVDRFHWNQGVKGSLFVGKTRIKSRFGSLFFQSPTTMTVTDLKYLGAKIHFFTDRIVQDGFFIFDLSQPRIIDESRVAMRVDVTNILLSIAKKKKPWLTNPGFDADLTAEIKRRYPEAIPDDRSYLLLNRLVADFEKNRGSAILNSFLVDLDGSRLKGSGHFNRATGIAALKLSSDKPMPFSRLPFGQAQIRQAFDKFTLDLGVSGNVTSLERHDLNVSLKAGLIGNKTSEADGDVSVTINGAIKKAVLTTEAFSIAMNDGRIDGKGSLGLKDGAANVAFNCSKMDALTIVRLFSTVNIPAITDCQGSLTGNVKNPRLAISMSSADAGYEFLHFGPAHGDLLVDNGNLKLVVDSTSGDVGNSHLTLAIRDVFDSFKQATDLDTRHEGIDVRKLLKAQSLDGRISGTFSLKRRDTENTATGDFKATGFVFFARKVGDIATKIALKKRHLDVAPITIDVATPKITVVSQKGIAFDFDDTGYTLVGALLPELGIKGIFKKADRTHLKLDLDARSLPLKAFGSLLPFEPKEASLTGHFALDYAIYAPIDSRMKGQIGKLLLQLPEGDVVLERPASLDYDGRAFRFARMPLKIGEGVLTVDGAFGMEQNSSLHISGDVDFNAFADFNPFIAEADRPIAVDVTLKNDIMKPDVFGKAQFKGNSVSFRNLQAELDDIRGETRFDGKKISFGGMTLSYDDAPLSLDGFVTTDYAQISTAGLTLSGDEVPVHLENGLNALVDVDLKLAGASPIVISGKANVVEGQYNRDFGLANFIVRARDQNLGEERTRPFAMLPDATRIDIGIKNTGDFTIKNGLAELEMQADLKLVGTLAKPGVEGQIDFVSGKVNAFGIGFEDATGYAQFKRNDGLDPEISVVAKKEIQEYEIKAQAEGRLSNLRLKLDATPSLDRRDILALLFYGQTPDQLVGEKHHQFTQTAAISQLASVLSGPIGQLSGLDVVEVSGRQESSNATVQRLSVGKSLSQRLNLMFTTDLGVEDPERAVEMEYQLFDNFYFIAAKDVGDSTRYRFDVSFRLQSY